MSMLQLIKSGGMFVRVCACARAIHTIVCAPPRSDRPPSWFCFVSFLHGNRVVLQAIGTFVKGCFQAPGTPISQAFSTVQRAVEENRARTAAMRIGRTPPVRGPRRPPVGPSGPADAGVGEIDPGTRHRPSGGDGSANGGGGGGGSVGGGGGEGEGQGRVRPPAVPGPRRDFEAVAGRTLRVMTDSSPSEDARCVRVRV